MARPRLHDDALRTRLLDLASEAVSRDGERGLTVRAVAAAAGTSPSAVYTLFGSREDLLAAVSTEGFRRFAAHLAAVARTDDPAADLRALGEAYRRSALADPHYYRVLFDRGVRPGRSAPPAVEQPTFVVLRDAVSRLLAAGAPDGAPTPRPSDADAAETVAVALWGLVHGLVTLELAGQLPGTEDERAARFAAATGAVGPALLATVAPPP
ncbi:TetR family transcriptional regulator [Isoptericola jiangsuensis]|uniref:TetR family transcriptional regulator n=1 Tax=Isoptericola jiangsuensis TaxID=548579 RepID=A0A2A9EW39_9MICO|nr:TetR/AcrR family transcriptional regulator [Isoptericola jiangsuensis]PFG42796.1 TetR family transcriptional regulator [Isoptericola jiangsuensis]